MKTIVIYKSKSGFTKGYADWIAEALDCPAVEQKSITRDELMKYDTIVYGGGIYVGSIAGVKIITKNYDMLKDKNLIIFASGSGAGDDEELNKMWHRTLTGEQREHIKTFYLRGGFDYSKLGAWDKLLMNIFKKMLEKQDEPKEGMDGFLKSFHEPQDYRKKENIEELVKAASN